MERRPRAQDRDGLRRAPHAGRNPRSARARGHAAAGGADRAAGPTGAEAV